jgi:tetratricopeptide (TPR) repeat protein
MHKTVDNIRRIFISVAGITVLLFLVYAPLTNAAMDARSLYDQGMEAFKTGNYGSAELLFRKIVDSGDDEYLDRAWFQLARSIFNKGKYELALFEFKNFLNRCKTNNLSAESRYWMGESYYNLSDYPNAIEEFRRYITVAGETDLAQNAHDRIGTIYLAQKRYDEAIIEWETARSKSKDQNKNNLRQYWIGDALYRNGKYDEALQKLTSVASVNIDPKINAMADMVLGRIYQRKGDHQKALQMFGSIPPAILKEAPFSDVQYFKARSSIRVGQKTQARAQLEAFIAGSRDSRWFSNAQYELGGMLLDGPDHEEGLKLLEEVRSGSPRPALKSRAALKLGQYYADHNPEKSIPYLDEALKSTRQDRRKGLLEFTGKTCLRAKKYDKAIDYFNQYLKENPFDKSLDEINFLRARAYLELGQIDKATAIFEANRRENPFSKYISESNYYMALVRYKEGNTGKAITLLREYLGQKNVELAYEAQVLLVRIYLEKDDIDNAGRAVDALTRDFMNRKDVETVLYDYATALMRKERDARRYVNLVLNRFPGTESAADMYMVLGNDSFSRNRYNAALECFNNYLHSPYTKNRGNAFYKMLVSLFNLKRYDDVIAAIKKGNFPSMSESQWKEIPLLQARSYYAMEKYEDVYMSLEVKNMRDYPKEDILMYIRCALKTGDYRSAIEANEFLESSKMHFSESLYIIGDYLLRNDHRDEAELYFLKIIRECPGTPYADHARLSLGEMNLLEKKYIEAISYLSTADAAADRAIINRKNSLLIRCYIEMGRVDDAASLTEKNLQGLAESEFGEQVFLGMMRFYYKKGDLQQFERYSRLLARYRGNEAEVNYLSAKIYYQAGNYHNAYNQYFALSKIKSPHQDEALYFLGIYSLLVNRNPGNALTYFSKILEMPEGSETAKRKALIQCAIIYREMNNNEKARECLSRVLAVQHRGLTHIQAINLFNEFNYTAK